MRNVRTGWFSRLRPFRLRAVLYEVTARCNLACPHCYNVWKAGCAYETEELDTTQAKALIAKAIRESRCEQFTFTGGEPCLRADLEELVAFAKARVSSVALISNGTLLDEGRIQGLLRAGVELFELPLHAGEAAAHDKALGCPGSFLRVTQAAVAIRQFGGHVAFVFVGTRQTFSHWPEALELGIALGCRNFLLNRWNAGGSGHDEPENLMPTVAQVREGLEMAEAAVRKYGVSISASIPLPPCLLDTSAYPGVGFGFCAAGTESAYYTLDPMGSVRPCNHTRTVLGDLRQQSFRSLARGKTMASFVSAKPGFCLGCAKENTCMGGCKAAAEVCFGDLCACEPFLAQNLSLAKKLRPSLMRVEK